MCSRSTAAALNSDSAEAISVNATMVISSPTSVSLPKSLPPGGWMASMRPLTSTRATGRSRRAVARVAVPTATSGPGSSCALPGSFFHSVMTATVPAPIPTAVSA